MRGDYEAAPSGDGRWKAKQQGGNRAVKIHDTQAEAWEHAKDLARNAGVEALLKNRDGQIRERNTYSGRDPFPPRG